jgi:hypothetical protein
MKKHESAAHRENEPKEMRKPPTCWSRVRAMLRDRIRELQEEK